MMRSNRPTHSPFDSTAIDRLRRMGLATADGSVERDAMAVFCCIFAGQFYDDLCDYHQDDVQAVKAAVTPLVDGVDTGNPQGKFLMICLQYDSIYRSLPDRDLHSFPTRRSSDLAPCPTRFGGSAAVRPLQRPSRTASWPT